MEQVVSDGSAAPRFRTALSVLFALLAVCLSVTGVYGAIAYEVNQRWNEIGLRMALGASTGSVLRLVLGHGVILAGVGLIAGLAATAAATRFLTAMLFQVRPVDPLIYAAVAFLLSAITVTASYVPARRASRIDPMAALRED
jgi:ABC-type antimicrobial peptide transport system permease subunit